MILGAKLWAKLTELMKFHALVLWGRLPDKKLFLVGPQMACWQYARLKTVAPCARLSMLGVFIQESLKKEISGRRSSTMI